MGRPGHSFWNPLVVSICTAMLLLSASPIYPQDNTELEEAELLNAMDESVQEVIDRLFGPTQLDEPEDGHRSSPHYVPGQSLERQLSQIATDPPATSDTAGTSPLSILQQAPRIRIDENGQSVPVTGPAEDVTPVPTPAPTAVPFNEPPRPVTPAPDPSVPSSPTSNPNAVQPMISPQRATPIVPEDDDSDIIIDEPVRVTPRPSRPVARDDEEEDDDNPPSRQEKKKPGLVRGLLGHIPLVGPKLAGTRNKEQEDPQEEPEERSRSRREQRRPEPEKQPESATDEPDIPDPAEESPVLFAPPGSEYSAPAITPEVNPQDGLSHPVVESEPISAPTPVPEVIVPGTAITPAVTPAVGRSTPVYTPVPRRTPARATQRTPLPPINVRIGPPTEATPLSRPIVPSGVETQGVQTPSITDSRPAVPAGERAVITDVTPRATFAPQVTPDNPEPIPTAPPVVDGAQEVSSSAITPAPQPAVTPESVAPVTETPAPPVITPVAAVRMTSPTLHTNDLALPAPAMEENEVIREEFISAIKEARGGNYELAANMFRTYGDGHPSSKLAPRAYFLAAILSPDSNAIAEASAALREKYSDDKYTRRLDDRMKETASPERLEEQLSEVIGTAEELGVRVKAAQAYAEKRNSNRVVELLEPMISKSAGAPEEAEVFVLLSEAYMAKRNLSEAARMLNQIQQKFPEVAARPRVRLNFGLVNEEAGYYQRASALYNQIILETPDAPEAQMARDRLRDLRRMSE